jgi:hypothetical protein
MVTVAIPSEGEATMVSPSPGGGSRPPTLANPSKAWDEDTFSNRFAEEQLDSAENENSG